MEMEASKGTIVISILVAIAVLVWTWKVVNWLWLRPKKLEKLLRKQGLQGTSYTLLSVTVTSFTILLSDLGNILSLCYVIG